MTFVMICVFTIPPTTVTVTELSGPNDRWQINPYPANVEYRVSF